MTDDRTEQRTRGERLVLEFEGRRVPYWRQETFEAGAFEPGCGTEYRFLLKGRQVEANVYRNHSREAWRVEPYVSVEAALDIEDVRGIADLSARRASSPTA